MKNITCENCINLKKGWFEKIIDSPDKFRKRDCQFYKAKTNADRIRKMSDEELAEFINNEVGDFIIDISDCMDCKKASCYKCILKLLQKEVEE